MTFLDRIRQMLHSKLDRIRQMLHSNTFFFVAAIFTTAILTWIMRSFVDSDPDPFFLNLTFFAFAGQCIRIIELTRTNSVKGAVGFLILLACLIVMIQIAVLKEQKTATLEHYKELLVHHRNKMAPCSENEIDHWANSLLQVSGIDFHPGYYQWLERFAFTADPRARSRENAFSILPSSHFVIDTPEFTADSLIVPDAIRVKLWNWYWITCLGSWICFVITMVVSHKPTSINHNV